MDEFSKRLSILRRRKPGSPPALMTHVVLGYPNLKTSVEIVHAMSDAGADFIELQIPFSDPMADGPTIMAANELALANGVTVKNCFQAAEKLCRRISTPLLFMSYFNIVYRYNRGKNGVANFCRDAASAGMKGLIIPDVPPEENSEGYWTASQKNGLAAIPIVSPVSSPERIREIKKVAKSGFIYCVTQTGTTGARKALPPELGKYLANIRRQFSLPLAVGFGISNRAQVQAVGKHADIAIVGSAVISLLQKTPKGKQAAAAGRFVTGLR